MTQIGAHTRPTGLDLIRKMTVLTIVYLSASILPR